MTDSSSIESKLAELRASFAGRLDEKLREVESSAKIVTTSEEPMEVLEAVKTLRQLAHKLVGSGATFGFTAVSEVARVLEASCISGIEQDSHVSPVKRDEIRGLVKDLGLAASSADVSQAGEEDSELESSKVSAPIDEDKSVILVASNIEQVRNVEFELPRFGFMVRRVTDPESLRGAIASAPPNAIVVDLTYTNKRYPEADIIKELRQEGVIKCPVVFLSSRTDVPSRLMAVRAGCNAFVAKPVVAAELLDELEFLTTPADSEPYRVLIVDDDPDMAHYAQIVLESAGMITRVVTDGLEIGEHLAEFVPELILMDLYMPKCDGAELAAVIRQQKSFAGIPIVFLSSESDSDQQLGAMGQGGDDFLVKPARSHRLVASVRLRAERFRALRSMMACDSLTGLYNHTTSNQLMETEIARAFRSSTPLAVAMLDIDHFKGVNDTYGHGVGDHVIRSLARLMKQRLRKTDIIGRVGGEEFLVVVTGSTGADAIKIFDDLRTAFSGICHQAAEGEFFSTVSCGIAEYPHHEDASSLLEAADRALYAAKHGGRNQVVLARPVDAGMVKNRAAS